MLVTLVARRDFVGAMNATIPTRRLARSTRLRDVAVTAVAFALTLALLAGGRGSSRALDPLAAVLAAAACVPLLERRRWPLGVFAVTTAASATLNGLGYAVGPPFGPTAALFFVAADLRTRKRLGRTAGVVLGLFAVHIGATAIAHPSFPAAPILFGILVWGGAFVVGDQVRQRRQRNRDLIERARRAERDLHRERRLAAAEERTRIARDLHDSVAHAINVILVQAGAARLLQSREPGAAQAALSTIEDVARETIGEIDLLVRGLREDRDSADVEPPPGLAALETLAGRYRAAGQALDVHVAGTARPLPRAVDQAAYRILQESLTNAARHGGGAARVDVRYGERELELSIANPIGATTNGAPAAGGHGILGMRERASLLGGTVEAGSEGRAFRVRARLPYAGTEQ
jgi:signal transduction histidine kinase